MARIIRHRWPRSVRAYAQSGHGHCDLLSAQGNNVQGINNTSSKIIKIQNNEFSDRPRKCTFCSRTLHMANDASLKSPLLNKGCHTS